MENFDGHYTSTKTTKFLFNLSKFLFVLGFPNYWVENLDFPEKIIKLFNVLNKVGNFFIFILILTEYAAFVTQKNLTHRQSSDLILFTISHTTVCGFCVRMHMQEGRIRDVMCKLGIRLKEAYNDSEIEEQMIRRSKFFSSALMFNCCFSVLMYSIEAVIGVIRTDVTFNTIITAWPDVEDKSVTADVLRAVFYIIWMMYVSRIFAVYTLVISLTIAISHQFKNLNSYFYNVDNLFNEDSEATQNEKEEQYENAIKVGIKLHSETLKCTDQIQTICRDVFSGQIVFNLTLLILLMYQLVKNDTCTNQPFLSSARNLTNALTLLTTVAVILLSTGLFMWNAGDITVEAEELPTAMFCSGWQNCTRYSSVRIRKLIVVAMMQAQQPVVLTGLGVIGLSYQSYVSVVKSSYSVFSVVY